MDGPEKHRDLLAFRVAANFTRAAAKLGVSQSALSHTIRMPEALQAMPDLTTTRSVAPDKRRASTSTASAPVQEIDARFLNSRISRSQPDDPRYDGRARRQNDPRWL